MSEPEIEYLRKSLDELREKIYDRDHDYASELGYSKGWREAVGVRIDRIEKRLDSLIFSLLDARQPAAKAGKHSTRKISRRRDVVEQIPGDGAA